MDIQSCSQVAVISDKSGMMTKNIFSLRYCSVLCLAIIWLTGCSQQALDAEIKADITTKAKEDVNFAGVRFTVEDGKVTLSGSCPSTKSREAVKQMLSTIHVIKGLDDHLTIAPVVLNSSFTIKQQVDSVLSKYSGVTSVVSDTGVLLMGKIKSAELNKLLSSLAKVNPKVNTDRLIMER